MLAIGASYVCAAQNEVLIDQDVTMTAAANDNEGLNLNDQSSDNWWGGWGWGRGWGGWGFGGWGGWGFGGWGGGCCGGWGGWGGGWYY